MQTSSTGFAFSSAASGLPIFSLQPQPVRIDQRRRPTPFVEPIAGLYTRELEVREVFELLFAPEQH